MPKTDLLPIVEPPVAESMLTVDPKLCNGVVPKEEPCAAGPAKGDLDERLPPKLANEDVAEAPNFAKPDAAPVFPPNGIDLGSLGELEALVGGAPHTEPRRPSPLGLPNAAPPCIAEFPKAGCAAGFAAHGDAELPRVDGPLKADTADPDGTPNEGAPKAGTEGFWKAGTPKAGVC